MANMVSLELSLKELENTHAAGLETFWEMPKTSTSNAPSNHGGVNLRLHDVFAA